MAHVRQHPTYAKVRMKVGVVPDFSGANAIPEEVPTGAVDGVNNKFTLQFDPIPESVQVFKNGRFMHKGSSNDYTITGKEITFSEAPALKTVIVVNYRYLKS